MLLIILWKWCICVLHSILTYMKRICILIELPNISVLLLYKHINITKKKKKNPSTNSPKSFWDWVTNIPFRKCVFILIRLHHTRTKDTVHLARLAAKNTIFIYSIKPGLNQTVAFTAISTICYLLVPNTPHELLPWYEMLFLHGSLFWVLPTKLYQIFPFLHALHMARMHNNILCFTTKSAAGTRDAWMNWKFVQK